MFSRSLETTSQQALAFKQEVEPLRPDIEVAVRNGERYAVCQSSEPFLTTSQDFLDLLGWGSENGTSLYVLQESAFAPEFYDLKTGLAGDILQKATTYGVRLAIVGTFDGVKSKRFRELMTEANRGHQFRFTKTHDEAAAWLVGTIRV